MNALLRLLPSSLLTRKLGPSSASHPNGLLQLRVCVYPSIFTAPDATATSNDGSRKRSPSWNSMMTNLIRSENLGEARRVFDRIPCPDVYHYTIMITAYSQYGRIGEALQMFDEMAGRDAAAWNSMIKGCLQCGELSLARNIFEQMPERNVISWTTVVNGLARFGRIEEAEELFCKMPHKDSAAWNSMISGYCSNGRVEDALSLFERMPCRNVISWTALIGGLDQNGRSEESLSLFRQMLVSGIEPTSNTFASVMTACANAMDLCLGTQFHSHLVKSGAIFDEFISTSLITLYANCKQVENSRRIHQENKRKTVVSWTALITGYGSNGEHRDALAVFRDMKRAEILPNQSTFTSVLNSCGGLEDLEKGKEIHGNAVKLGFGRDVFVGNSLIFMYSKCGQIDDAVTIFYNLNERNIVSWNSIMTGCAQNGCGSRALRFYKDMVLSLVQPDDITFVALLTVCSHSKMVEKAKYFYRLLSNDPFVKLKLEHCICMVDALCRSGNLEEAEDFINSMPLKPDAAVWLTLLSACRLNLNVEIAVRAAENVFELEPDCSAAHVLLSNVYAFAGRWDDVSRIRAKMKCRGILKLPGYSGLH